MSKYTPDEAKEYMPEIPDWLRAKATVADTIEAKRRAEDKADKPHNGATLAELEGFKKSLK